MKTAGARRLRRLLWVGLLAVSASACAPSLWDRWQGSGERFEGRLFQLALEMDRKGPVAVWLDERGASTRLAVCQVREGPEGQVEFQFDPESPALTCNEMRHPWIARGRMGGHVLTGDLFDPAGSRIGRFRVLRTDL